MDDRLYRSRNDRMLAGVAGGLAEHYDLDPSLVRIGWALLILGFGAISGLVAVILYFATGTERWLWAAVPACVTSGFLLFFVGRYFTRML